MEIDLLFYTRKDYGGWRRYTWLPVEWAQGKYVHCELFAHSRVLNASNREGVIWDTVGKFMPSGRHTVELDDDLFEYYVATVIGQSYSWETFFKLLWPRWGTDPKGLICSELVAYILANCAKSSYYAAPFIAVPPHRWTPNQVFDALTNLKEHAHESQADV